MRIEVGAFNSLDHEDWQAVSERAGGRESTAAALRAGDEPANTLFVETKSTDGVDDRIW